MIDVFMIIELSERKIHSKGDNNKYECTVNINGFKRP